jgi:hypothetical protein
MAGMNAEDMCMHTAGWWSVCKQRTQQCWLQLANYRDFHVLTTAGHHTVSLLLLLPAAALLLQQLSVPGQGLRVEFTQPGYIQDGSKQVAAFGPTLRLRRYGLAQLSSMQGQP